MLRPWICLPAALGVLLADEAAACTPDPCAGTTAFVGLQRVGAGVDVNVDVPIDGVLVLQAQWFGEVTAAQLVDALTLLVSADGELVDGSVEAIDRPGMTDILLWRPAELLRSETTYTVNASYLNGDDVPGECAAKQVDIPLEFTTTAGKAEPLAAPKVWSDSSYGDSPLMALDSMVCCDGAYPVAQELCDIPQGLAWTKGKCVPTMSRAWLSASMGVASILDNPTAAQWARTLYQDGDEVETSLKQSFTRSLTEPACFTIIQFSLATGESITSEERCVGEDLILPLGDLPLDPTPMLAELCEDTPYICEANDDGWVPERCRPWPLPATQPEPASTGCSVGEPGAGLGLLALLLVVRRRRGSSRSITR
ncbi:hypothetical protein [Nannocystis sp.]|uniref:hypothetical protein n=1 Tax=Nannocystis sp. TaxID=1962667 RepID=UPI0025CBF2D6|nr:hypothetical protein [Nannocystis sp.]MBK7824985.1 hypothetical protein [Nannocystis sp.]